MGRIFCVESKSFEFILDSGDKSLCLKIIERGMGSIRSDRLGREGIFWLSSIVEVLRLENCKGFFTENQRCTECHPLSEKLQCARGLFGH